MKKISAVILTTTLLFPGTAVLTALPAQATVTAPAAMSNIVHDDNLYQVQEIFDEINKFRASKGLKPVKYNLIVEEVAQEWSDKMASDNAFIHNPDFWTDPRVSEGRTNSGEIIAGNYNRSGKSLVEFWIGSPAHNAIMSNPAMNTVGIGVTFTDKSDGRMGIYGNVNFHNYPNGKAQTYANPTDARKATAKSPFRDVPTNHLFYNEIKWMNSAGISTGYTDGTYRPAENVNRDAMAAFLYRTAGSPAYTPPRVSPFTDVSTSNQFYKEIAWMASTGISTGWNDGSFRPYESMNRDSMAAFLYRAAGSPAYTAPRVSPFTDVSTGNQFYKEIAWMASTGISTGWSDKTFRPEIPVNRETMAAFLYRFDQKF